MLKENKVEEERRRKKAQHPRGFEPTTSFLVSRRSNPCASITSALSLNLAILHETFITVIKIYI